MRMPCDYGEVVQKQRNMLMNDIANLNLAEDEKPGTCLDTGGRHYNCGKCPGSQFRRPRQEAS